MFFNLIFIFYFIPGLLLLPEMICIVLNDNNTGAQTYIENNDLIFMLFFYICELKWKPENISVTTNKITLTEIKYILRI